MGEGDNSHQQVLAFGINCTAPQYIEDAINILRACCPSRPIIVYPNSGETWDGQDKKWKTTSGVQDPELFADMAARWVKAGAQIVGGCCRTDWHTIAAIRRKVLEGNE